MISFRRGSNWQYYLQGGLATSELVDDDAAGEEFALPEVRLNRELFLLLKVARYFGRVLSDVRGEPCLVLCKKNSHVKTEL